MTDAKPTLAVLGGTGNLGFGLALRWARGLAEPPKERNAHRDAARAGKAERS